MKNACIEGILHKEKSSKKKVGTLFFSRLIEKFLRNS